MDAISLEELKRKIKNLSLLTRMPLTQLQLETENQICIY